MFKFKEIASLLASTVMVSSTVALAAAASYPSPFVQNGMADVAVVYGSHSAATADLVGVLNIQDSLNTYVVSGDTSTDGGSTITGGDAVLLSKASDNLNLNDTLSGVFGATVDSDDLAELLADGIYENDENTEYDYDQKITLGSGLQLNHFADTDYNDKAPTIGINMSGTHVVLNYTLNFIDQPESDLSSNDLVDFETTNLPLLGRNYYVLDADNSTSNWQFILLDSAADSVVDEGETVTLSVGSTTYEVSIDFIGSSEVKLNVNGESTNTLSEGGTEKLSDGTYLGIKDILVQDYSGGSKSVEFSIGSGKLDIKNGNTVKLNEDTVSGLTAYITPGTPNGARQKLSKIVLEWKTDDDQFITPDSELAMPGFGAVKFTSDDFFMEEKELTVVKNSGSDTMEITFDSPKDGRITVPFLFANASGEFTNLGESSTEQVLTGFGLAGQLYNRTIHDYLIASWNNTRDAETYILRFEQFTEDTGVNKTTPEKLTESGWTDACGEKTDSGGATPTCDIGSLSLTLNKINAKESTGGKYVNFTGNAGSSFYRIYTAGGLEINMPVNIDLDLQGGTTSSDGAINLSNFSVAAADIGHSKDSFWLFAAEEDKDGNLGLGAKINVSIDDQSDGDLEVAGVSSPRADEHQSLEDDDNLVHRVESDLATEFWRYGSSTAQRHAEITYPGAESYMNVYLAAPDAEVTSSGGSSGGTSTVGVPITDLEISDVAGKNLVVVGGSCVNTVAADLLGSSNPLCGADFTSVTSVGSGEFLIETFDQGDGTIATLVAGYDASDTTNAATYLTTQTVDTTAGMKYVGTTSTSAELVTSEA